MSNILSRGLTYEKNLVCSNFCDKIKKNPTKYILTRNNFGYFKNQRYFDKMHVLSLKPSWNPILKSS